MKAVLSALVPLVFTVVANAHFQISFPPPRGPFVEDNEPKFCDGFVDVTTNRTEFPLSGGFINMTSEHPKWTAAFYVSTVENPNSFDDFVQVNSFFQGNGEGSSCITLDFATSNVTNLRSGENATIQMLFNGGDGSLFQCSDVILTNSTNNSSAQCTNPIQPASGTPTQSGSGASSQTPTQSGSGALGQTPYFSMKQLTCFLSVVALIPLVGFL